jgi:hypothetical protein
VVVLLTGCGDNGPLPTLMGRHDYAFTLPADWQDTYNDTLQVLFNSVMADRTVTEHMLFRQGGEGGTPTILIVGSDRGGPYSRADMKRQLDEYLARPVKKKPLKVVSSLDDGTGTLSVESHHPDTVFIMRRIYTKKGYIQANVMCPLNAPQTMAEARAIMDSLAPAPDLAL